MAFQSRSYWLVFAVAFLVLVGLAFYFLRLSVVIVFLYLLFSAASFVAYVFDKRAAKYGFWRTSEGTLHALSFCFGWPGAIFGQQLLRHKTWKSSFRRTFWITMILNLALFLWLLTPGGMAVLDLWVDAWRRFFYNVQALENYHDQMRALERLIDSLRYGG